jgi:hypothetical protein
MSTFKADLYEICKEVATEFPGWIFTSGKFKNKSLKHSDLVVDPGFFFERGFTSLQPSIWLENKRCAALCAELLGLKKGQSIATSMVNFQAVGDTLSHMPEVLRVTCLICQDKKSYIDTARALGQYDEKQIEALEARSVDVKEVFGILIAMMKDALSFIDSHYDLSSEEGLLKGLPAKYATRNQIIYDEMEKQKGLMMCVVRILMGDFDFVVNYRSDEFKTIFPKRVTELDKIIVMLPELKKRYAETGSVI